MDSTTRTQQKAAAQESATPLAWCVWPLVDNRRWSWLAPVAVAFTGVAVWYLGRGWFLALLAAAGLAATLWQIFLPVGFEVVQLGLRRHALGRTRLVPWHAIRSYRLRPSGVVLYQRSEPTKLDLLRSMFVPYPPKAEGLLSALRRYAAHAVELRE